MEIETTTDDTSTEVVDGVHLTQGAAGEQASIQRFYIEPGAEVPEHDHPHEQVGTITQGTLTFIVDGEERLVHTGDTYIIPGDEPHAAINDQDVPVEGFDIFAPPRANPDWKE